MLQTSSISLHDSFQKETRRYLSRNACCGTYSNVNIFIKTILKNLWLLWLTIDLTVSFLVKWDSNWFIILIDSNYHSYCLKLHIGFTLSVMSGWICLSMSIFMMLVKQKYFLENPSWAPCSNWINYKLLL